MKPLIAIVGPTAIGKSDLALRLAQYFDGEIVSADSRQVYRYMDIGTAKPTIQERALVPHHAIDIIEPNESFSLTLYQELASEAMDDIWKRGKQVFLVGGSGLYVWAVVEGWKVPEVAPDQQFRRHLEQQAETEGVESLHMQLRHLDPDAAERIDPRNVRRVIRAMEVIRATGVPCSSLQHKEAPAFPVLIIGLTTSRENLYDRIDKRVDQMMKHGFMDEVGNLLDKGYNVTLPPMSSMGYKQIGQYLRGEISLSVAIEQTKFETHRFARHQYAWFHLTDARIHWFDITQDYEKPISQLLENMNFGIIK